MTGVGIIIGRGEREGEAGVFRQVDGGYGCFTLKISVEELKKRGKVRFRLENKRDQEGLLY